ncbi:hypothetical protein HFP57_13305 [Parasphingopyxis algicola]|uniref:hypothetical protein n=1 Tax=Parasphingopyxis algicola TaxID=2026624 RepID=UPI0015A06D37|nr:hypothetical protein [Parasphingopyxis algicola]QLC25904.1 hypothetical protein HFP57_13305 [Parasphingopyxis algicola]
MAAFRTLLVLLCLGIVLYTAIVVGEHGMNLFPAFFGDIAALGWPGQFNVDFLSFLILSAVWVAWRHAFSTTGFALALLAFSGGGLFLTIYLLIASFSADGDIRIVLLGPSRAAP